MSEIMGLTPLEKECKEAVGYADPNARVCKNCICFHSTKVRNFGCGEPQLICWCDYLFAILHKKRFFFHVEPEGSCPNFRKKPVRCFYYNTAMCDRRKCRKIEYDDNCMEIT